MKSMMAVGVTLCSISFVSVVTASVTQAPKVVLPDGPGKTELQGTCLKCHAPNVIAAKRKTKDEWSQTIVRMQGLGAEVSDDDFEPIATYLTAHFGPLLNVNKATEQQLVVAFAITSDQAVAIVKYRTDHGEFKSLDDLLKVPGVDAARIRGGSNSIAFQDPPPTPESGATTPKKN